jgi:hypothetical protein
MNQLAFPFADALEPAAVSRSTLYWRKRIDRAVRRAFELGRRQRKPAPQPRSLGAAVAPMPSRFEPVLDEANELMAIAARLARLTVRFSRRKARWSSSCGKSHADPAMPPDSLPLPRLVIDYLFSMAVEREAE